MDGRARRIALCLGAIAALGPFAMDMYLAAMPSMSAHFRAAEGEIELSVRAFFIGFCAGQLVLGPVSDRTGRKPVIFFGLGCFFAGAVGCIFAPDLRVLEAFRVLQGFGGSIGMVIAMASVRDLFTGAAAAQMMGMVSIVLGLAPVLAPVIGGAIVTVAPWEAIFALLAVMAAAVFVLVWRGMPEPRDPEMCRSSHPSRAFGTYLRLLVARDFIPYAGAMALTQAGLFAYLAGASMVLMTVYGLSPLGFAVAFGINAFGIAVLAQTTGRLVGRFGAVRLARMAVLFRAAVGLAMLLAALTGTVPLPLFLVLCFFFIASLGIVFPSASILALEKQGQNAGAAAALMGALGFGAGALMSALVSRLADGTAVPLLVLLALTAFAAAACSLGFARREAPVVVPRRA